MKEELAEALHWLLGGTRNRSPPYLCLWLTDERPKEKSCRESWKKKDRWKPRDLLPHLSGTVTHISKFVVPEVGLVTLEQLYRQVTVLSIAFLTRKKKRHRHATVSD